MIKILKSKLPDNEENRLEALKLYDILDTLPEQVFDDLTLLASNICNTPISVISFVDKDRQWFKSVIGMDLNEVNRDFGFCSHAILETNTMIIPDAKLDNRFVDNPFVTSENGIRYYAGTPLITKDGYALGTLCVIDTAPRQLTLDQIKSLEALSRQVMTQLENKKNVIDLENTKNNLEIEVSKVNKLNFELSESEEKLKNLS